VYAGAKQIGGISRIDPGVPDHQGIPGNETTDELAGLGTHMNPEAPVVGVPFATGKNIIKG